MEFFITYSVEWLNRILKLQPGKKMCSLSLRDKMVYLTLFLPRGSPVNLEMEMNGKVFLCL